MADPRRRMVADPSLTVNDVIMTSLRLLKFINVFSNFYLLVFFALRGKIDGTWILPASNRISGFKVIEGELQKCPFPTVVGSF